MVGVLGEDEQDIAKINLIKNLQKQVDEDFLIK